MHLMRGLAPGAVRSAALQPDFVQPVVVAAPVAARLGSPPASPVVPPPPAPAARSAPEAVAPAQPLVVGSPQALVASTPPVSPSERLPAAIRPRPGFATGDAATAGVGVEVPSMGSWFVDLGPLAEEYWRGLRETHRAATAGLYRLASGGDGAAPFVVGPFDTAEDADTLCHTLAEAVTSCTAIRL
jgi:hypothetical protein